MTRDQWVWIWNQGTRVVKVKSLNGRCGSKFQIEISSRSLRAASVYYQCTMKSRNRSLASELVKAITGLVIFRISASSLTNWIPLALLWNFAVWLHLQLPGYTGPLSEFSVVTGRPEVVRPEVQVGNYRSSIVINCIMIYERVNGRIFKLETESEERELQISRFVSQ